MVRSFRVPGLAMLAFGGLSCASAIPDDLVGGDAHPSDGHVSTGIDAHTTTVDAHAAAADAQITAGHTVLLSEVCLGPGGKEFVEIVNPTDNAVDLEHYYLSDNGNYYKLPAAGSATPIDSGDFIVQFPPGASIAPQGVVTIAIGSAAAFTTGYGAAPTYSITDATILNTEVSGTPSLTDTGEIIVLFQWDGASDLVRDVDILLAGKPTTANGFVNKSGYAQDGPDTGDFTSTYLTDADSMTNQANTAGSNKSTKRIALETGHETQTGAGNGISGDDETSEVTTVTWDGSSFTAPTPGAVPAILTE